MQHAKSMWDFFQYVHKLDASSVVNWAYKLWGKMNSEQFSEVLMYMKKRERSSFWAPSVYVSLTSLQLYTAPTEARCPGNSALLLKSVVSEKRLTPLHCRNGTRETRHQVYSFDVSILPCNIYNNCKPPWFWCFIEMPVQADTSLQLFLLFKRAIRAVCDRDQKRRGARRRQASWRRCSHRRPWPCQTWAWTQPKVPSTSEKVLRK